MADISKLKLNNVIYNLKDAGARQMIENLPEPMVFKGSLGTGGTISTLPTAASEYEGFVYKVITNGTYAGQSARVGDLFICNDEPAWILIPSGDDPSGQGTVTNVATGTGLTGGPITTSGTISIDFNEVQSKLVSGTNIKTINGTSILGSGSIDANNVFIATKDVTTYDELVDAIDNNKLIIIKRGQDNDLYLCTHADYSSSSVSLDGLSCGYPILLAVGVQYNIISTTSEWVPHDIELQNKLVSGSNIKTINNNSLLGSGDLQISVPTYTAGDGIGISNDTVSNTAGMYLGTDVESATNLIDADLLGGHPSSYYATQQWVQDYIASLDATGVSY